MGDQEREITMEDALAVPAVLANRVNIAMTPAGARISFVEQAGPSSNPFCRAAVVMGVQDVISFKNLLVQMLHPIEEGLKAVTAMEAAEAQNPQEK